MSKPLPNPEPQARGPLISVVIATCKRRDRLKGCLASLTQQISPAAGWELIVVEDGDREPLDAELLALAELLPLRWYRVDHAGCGMAKNAGAWQAHGRYVVFTDDDCRFPVDWLRGYEREFSCHPDALVVGHAINPRKANAYADASQELVNYILSRWNSSSDKAAVAIGNNFGVPAKDFQDLRGFNPSYFPMAGEDRDFAAYWVESGRPSRYVSEVVVEHAQDLTFRSLLRQQYFYGRGAFIFHKLEAQRQSSGAALESPNFYLSLFAWPWRVRKGVEAVRMAALFLCAQAAHLAGYIGAAREPANNPEGRMERALASLTEVSLSISLPERYESAVSQQSALARSSAG